MSFQDVLISSRKAKKIPLWRLAEMSGVSKSTISSYECGVQPTIDKADKILRALGISYTLGRGDAYEPPIN